MGMWWFARYVSRLGSLGVLGFFDIGENIIMICLMIHEAIIIA